MSTVWEPAMGVASEAVASVRTRAQPQASLEGKGWATSAKAGGGC